jgi:PKD repeat protein
MAKWDDGEVIERGRRMKRVLVASSALAVVAILAITAAITATAVGGTAGWRLVGWNNLGMHCMDSEFNIFSILPPYNTIEAQLVDTSGNLVKSGNGITVTYEAVADPTGSINTTSVGKTDFWQNVFALFGASPAPDAGLAGSNMPGTANVPQPMTFDATQNLFQATGIPITPYDDAHAKNYYPLMRLTAKNASGTVLATTDVVLPVSDEMDCKACHASNSSPPAMPFAGWVNDPDPEHDYRLNVLKLHDDLNTGNPTYASALAARGYNAAGLYPTVTQDGKPILCAGCHLSEALPGTGFGNIPPLTAAVHSRHANVTDPTNGMTLDASDNRTACYRCHPGSLTRCLRGVMGNSVAADGTMAMQCQNCHGPMSAVGAANRTGWLDEPNCQGCHTGTAVNNNGQIRYTSALLANGQPRVAVNATFATTPDTPAPGFSLYRFSSGHGGLQCSSCHGSTHAEFPSSHDNDNIQSLQVQGHAGPIAECVSCHPNGVSTVNGGPHGMHPVGQTWIEGHKNAAEGGASACRACHGVDYRGTVLSQSFADRTLNTEFGTKQFWNGFQIGCYTCHNGPNSESRNPNAAPVVTDLSASTTAGNPVAVALHATDANGNPLVLRVVSQPKNGTAGLVGTTATYYPYDGFGGTDSFTYAANDNQTDSNLGHVTVNVSGGSVCTVTCAASAPSSGQTGSSVSFTGSATASACADPLTYDWNFGDGSAHAFTASASHTYTSAGTYAWSFTASAGTTSCSKTGTITIGAISGCTVTCSASAPSSAQTGNPVSFTGSATASACAGPLTYDWNFGDGSAHASTASASHTYASAGTYTWSFTASAGTTSCNKTGTITVSATSCTVTCSASVPSTGRVGQELSFSGSASSSCQGEIRYQWQFGDGTGPSGDRTTTHKYTAPGTYTWQFTATQNGASCSKSGTITISTAVTPPVISQITQLSNPFRLRISGSNFQSGVKVYIGSDSTPWSNTTRSSSSSLTLGGSGLRNKFPRGVTVAIRVVNPDGGSATGSFRRSG